MAVFSIKNMKVVSPSPDNFILKLDLSKNGQKSKSYNFIASGEHIYVDKKNDGSEINNKLLDKHVAHSMVFGIPTIEKPITAFSLFDMNDLAITTHDGIDDRDTIYLDNVIDNLLVMPNGNMDAYDRENNYFPMHSINSNAVYGYMKTNEKSFGFPGYVENKDSIIRRKFFIKYHNQSNDLDEPTTNITAGTSDTLTLYRPHNYATHISTILGLNNQLDIKGHDGFDKLFIFDPTDNNKLIFQKSSLSTWRGYQSNISWYQNQVTNNFDIGTLLVRAILFPKQTLNNEYSTERNYVNGDISKHPFNYVRKYNWNEDYFYSNGTNIVLNHVDSDQFRITDKSNNNKILFNKDKIGIPKSGTMVTSTYSRRFANVVPHEHNVPTPPSSVTISLNETKSEEVKVDYNNYDLLYYSDSNIDNMTGLYNQYSPEIFNRANETQSDTSLMSSLHKANIFDIQFKDLWSSISKQFTDVESYNDNKESFDGVRENLKETIKSNLFKLVDEIKPVHTHLYRIKMED